MFGCSCIIYTFLHNSKCYGSFVGFFSPDLCYSFSEHAMHTHILAPSEKRYVEVWNVHFRSYLWYYKVLFVSSPTTAAPAPIWIRAFWLRAEFKRWLVSRIIFLMKKVWHWVLWLQFCLSGLPRVDLADRWLRCISTCTKNDQPHHSGYRLEIIESQKVWALF